MKYDSPSFFRHISEPISRPHSMTCIYLSMLMSNAFYGFGRRRKIGRLWYGWQYQLQVVQPMNRPQQPNQCGHRDILIHPILKTLNRHQRQPGLLRHITQSHAQSYAVHAELLPHFRNNLWSGICIYITHIIYTYSTN